MKGKKKKRNCLQLRDFPLKFLLEEIERPNFDQVWKCVRWGEKPLQSSDPLNQENKCSFCCNSPHNFSLSFFRENRLENCWKTKGSCFFVSTSKNLVCTRKDVYAINQSFTRESFHQNTPIARERERERDRYTSYSLNKRGPQRTSFSTQKTLS